MEETIFMYEPYLTTDFPTKEKGYNSLPTNTRSRERTTSPIQSKRSKNIPPSIQFKQDQLSSSIFPSQEQNKKVQFSPNSANLIQKKATTFNEDIAPLIDETTFKVISPPIPMCVNTESSGLNLREDADETSTAKKSLKQGDEVTADKVDTGWYHVTDQSKDSGYVRAQFVLEQQPMPITRMRVDITSETLTLRNNPSNTGAVKDRLQKDERLDAFKSLTGWYKVNTVRANDNKDGYVSSDFVKPDIEMSNFEYHPYEPDVWNDGDKKWAEYNATGDINIIETSQQYTTNCYAYAFNYKRAPADLTGVAVKEGEFFGTLLSSKPKGFGMQPGYLSGTGGIDRTVLNKTAVDNDETIINLVKADAEANHGLTFTELTSSSNGGNVVALVVRPSSYETATSNRFSPDYHWYRLNDDGTWSHKPGATKVTDKTTAFSKPDKNGESHLIESNESITDPIQAGRAIGYTSFLGYFMIK
jgi:uncharacterized protein YgiM (DUF1202 family)